MVMTLSSDVTGVTTGSKDVIIRIVLLYCLEGSLTVLFVIMRVNQNVICVSFFTQTDDTK